MRSFFVLGCALNAATALAQSTVLFQTSFEPTEGYDPNYTLAFQNGWLSEGSGGNGLITDIPGLGQQAYIGFFAPTNRDDFTTVWRPPAAAVPAGTKAIRFSTVMQIVPSTGGGSDEFRWSVFNKDENRLVSINFDTATREISYIPQDRVYRDTGFKFDFEGTYDLVIWLNFERNTWTAVFNDRIIVNAEPISSTPADLTFGDVDAVWHIVNVNGVGNNYMMFDDYRITAETSASIPSYLEPIGRNAAGNFTFNVYAEKNRNYSVDVSQDLVKWFSLATYDNPQGTFTFEDITSKNFPTGFYRVRLLN